MSIALHIMKIGVLSIADIHSFLRFSWCHKHEKIN